MTTQTILPHVISLWIKKRARRAYRNPPGEQALQIQWGKTEGHVDVKQTSHDCEKMVTRLHVLEMQFFSVVWLHKQNNFQNNQQI